MRNMNTKEYNPLYIVIYIFVAIVLFFIYGFMFAIISMIVASILKLNINHTMVLFIINISSFTLTFWTMLTWNKYYKSNQTSKFVLFINKLSLKYNDEMCSGSDKSSLVCKYSFVAYFIGWACFPFLYIYSFFVSGHTKNGYEIVYILIYGLILMGFIHSIGLVLAIISKRCKNKQMAILLNLLSLPLFYLLVCIAGK